MALGALDELYRVLEPSLVLLSRAVRGVRIGIEGFSGWLFFVLYVSRGALV